MKHLLYEHAPLEGDMNIEKKSVILCSEGIR